MNLRSKLVPRVLPEDDKILVKTAVEQGCGAKISGHGGGGCMWAIGSKESINNTRNSWNEILQKREYGSILPTAIAVDGLVVIART